MCKQKRTYHIAFGTNDTVFRYFLGPFFFFAYHLLAGPLYGIDVGGLIQMVKEGPPGYSRYLGGQCASVYCLSIMI